MPRLEHAASLNPTSLLILAGVVAFGIVCVLIVQRLIRN